MLTLNQMNPQQITTALASGYTLNAPPEPEPLESPSINWEKEYAERHGLPVRRVAEEVGDEDEDTTTHEHGTLAELLRPYDPALPTGNADGVPHLEAPTINWEDEYNARRGRRVGHHAEASAGGPPTNNEGEVPPLETPAIDWQAEYRARRK